MPLAKNDVSDGAALTTAEKSIKAHDECDPAFCSGREEHPELIFKIDNNILIIVFARSCRILRFLIYSILLQAVFGSCQLLKKSPDPTKTTKQQKTPTNNQLKVRSL